ncbi:HAD hydrolase-like protein [Sphingomonas sp. S2-65]|uniref:HAD hydrolase-like protein n=1 Tax=Sphingomonas sp. S2-65 TaxID=2903960 RepID=UPI001F336843|nr:HAD hydrolase-like protein [Sphingomonas sp. S2-65]UYY58303.1 HAD hydrolase-like protein [Sphingomonas sp. S2-65]
MSEGAGGRALRLVIFDFDGTLSDSGDWFLSVADELARRFNFRRVCDAEVAMLRHKSSREVIAYLGIARWKLPLIARHTLKKLGIAPAEALAIGDETRDIDAAREVGMRTGAVLWGYASEAVLLAHQPDTLFRTPRDILGYVGANL